jgi:hypothetical protein
LQRRSILTGLFAGTASLVLTSLCLTLPATASTQLATAVSQTPVSWTPNVSAGPPPSGEKAGCNTTFFGSGNFSCLSEVFSTAYVNGDVVAVGSFTQVCQASTAAGHCMTGTTVTRDDIFAYSAGTGTIDPNFVPVLNAGPAYAVVAGPNNTVYVGGAFSTVDGLSHHGLVQLNVDPASSTEDGTVVTAFTGSVSKQVHALALNGNALYAGGEFTLVDGTDTFGTGGPKVQSLARLNATTGAVDNSFAYTLGDPLKGEAIQVEAMALSPDGTHLAIAGTAQQVNGASRPRLAIVDTGGALGAKSYLSAFTAPILTNNCSAEHDYVRGVDFSPDGSFIVIADTGYQNDGSMTYSACDALARFNVSATDNLTSGSVNVSPAWINYAGGDSYYSVAIAGDVVYAGGHNRWANNYCGNNSVCDENAVLVDGLTAVDANTGLALAWWHPQTSRGHGTEYVSTFPANTYDGSSAGLVQGTDAASIGGMYHSETAIFPLAATTSPTPGGPIPSGMFIEDGGSNTGTPLCIDDTADSSTAGTHVEANPCANDAEQNWNIESNNTIGINGMCMDTSGTSVVLNPCSGSTSQVWTQGPGNTVVNKATSQCLTDPGTAAGTQLQTETCSSSSTSQVWPLPVAQGPPAPPAIGELYPADINPAGDVLCLDDAGNKVTAGNKVVIQNCTGNTEQKWTMATNGTIEIDGNYCLDTSGPGPGTVSLVLNPCSAASTQHWTVGANYELVNTGATTANSTPYCLVDPGSNIAPGTQMQIAACSSGANYEWRLPAV